jgi:thiazole/oxazole-forming peptide maturase SagD family component
VTLSHLSILGSAGITLHDRDNNVAFLPSPLSLQEKREALARASAIAAQPNAVDEDPFVNQLARLIGESRRSGHIELCTGSDLTQVRPIRFTSLKDVGSRWSSGQTIVWERVKSDLQNLGYSLRERNPTTTDAVGIVNSSELIPVVEMIAPDGGVIAGGKGLVASDAWPSALSEAVERIIAQTPNTKDIFLSSEAALIKSGICVPKFVSSQRDAYSSQLCIDWTQAQTLQGAPAAIPAEKAFYNYEPSCGIRAFATQHTAGLASGASIEEAVWAGITECMERDAYWIVMRCKLHCPDIDTEIIRENHSELSSLVAAAGLRLYLKDISLDWPIKIVHAGLRDETGRIPAFSHGVGAHTSLKGAAYKAVLESLQIRSGLVRLCQKQTHNILLPSAAKDAPSAWSDPSSLLELSHLFEEAIGLSDPSLLGIEGLNPETIVESISQISGSIVWSNLGQKANLHVVRVILENCVPPDHDPSLISPRLQQWLSVTKTRFPSTFPILT